MPFHPSSLFAGGAYGYAFDATDASKVFQNIDGTGARADDAPVGRLLDVSGNARHFSALANDTTRPTARAAGTVEFDGSNDVLARDEAGAYNAGSCTIIVRMSGNGALSDRRWWGERDVASSNPFYVPGTGTNVSAGGIARTFTRNDSGAAVLQNLLTGVVAYDNVMRTLRFVDTGSLNSVFVDGVESIQRAYNRAGHSVTTNRTGLGALYRGTATSFFNGAIARLIVIGRLLTPQETADAEAWIASNAAADAASGAIAGSLNQQVGPVVSAGAARLALKAQGAPFLDPVTATSAGRLSIRGSATAVLAPVTMSSAGALAIRGSATAQLEPATMSASGSSGNAGNLLVTLEPVVGSGSARLAIAAALARFLDGVTLYAFGGAGGDPARTPAGRILSAIGGSRIGSAIGSTLLARFASATGSDKSDRVASSSQGGRAASSS